MTVNKELKSAIDFIKFKFNLTQTEIAVKLDVKKTYLSDMINGRVPFSDSIKGKIYELFSYNFKSPKNDAPIQMLSGGGESNTDSKLIPFYDDITTLGGLNDRTADVGSATHATEYIDTGDWFRDATAAIRHYGESMIEYPEGCILAVKEVSDRQLIVWGRDYLIETTEYRITKRVQRGKTEQHIRAYSSNPETYPDGTLVHEPIDIAWDDIRRIALVLGYVVKKNGGTMVFSNKKK